MTMKGIIILGSAAMTGVRREADMELAAIARWITRKSVHQYPNDITNPRPATSPKTSIPMGLSEVCTTYFQLWVITAGMREAMPCHPPAFITAMMASGEKPMTIRKNCSTSL